MSVTRLPNNLVFLTRSDAVKIEEILEHENGSATMKVDLTQEEVAMLLEYAMQDLLIRMAKEEVERKAVDSGS